MSKLGKRLGPWLPGGEPPNDGDAALRALADVADLRRSLEQAELLAVRTARRHGKSWTEIATMLTISRQSAWERWRELDGDAQPHSDEAVRGAAAELVGRVRRRRTVAVPDVIGLTSADALGILTNAGLEAVSATPGIELRDSGDDLRPTVVVRQYPDPGTRIQAASAVRLWLERGDGEAGVREPRRPTTPPRAARAERDERDERDKRDKRTEEAVGLTTDALTA
jgi:PASTA domain